MIWSIEPMRRKHLTQAMVIERDAYPRGWSQRLFAGELEQVRDRTRCTSSLARAAPCSATAV